MKKLLLLSLITSSLHAMLLDEYSALEYAGNTNIAKLFYKTAEERIATKRDLDLPVMINNSETLLEFFSYRDASMVKRLLEAGATATGKILAATIPGLHFEIAEELLKHKTNPNELCSGYTPLHSACSVYNYNQKSRIQFLKMLLTHNADPNIYDRDYHTPLIFLFSPRITEELTTSAINMRKQLIHELIFYGAHLKISKVYPTLTPVPLRAFGPYPEDMKCLELAKYTERRYYWRQLLLCRKKGGWFYILPKDLLKVIADKTV